MCGPLARCICQVGYHPNITQLKGVGWDCELPNKRAAGTKAVTVIVMELAERRELYDYLRYTGHFNEAASQVFFWQMMSGNDNAEQRPQSEVK